MKFNGKIHLLFYGETQKASNIDGNIIESESNQIIVPILIDSYLSYEEHINRIGEEEKGRRIVTTRLLLSKANG